MRFGTRHVERRRVGGIVEGGIAISGTSLTNVRALLVGLAIIRIISIGLHGSCGLTVVCHEASVDPDMIPFGFLQFFLRPSTTYLRRTLENLQRRQRVGQRPGLIITFKFNIQYFLLMSSCHLG